MDNWFTPYKLLCALEEDGILAVGTVIQCRMPNCSLKTDKMFKQEGRGTYNYKTEGTNITIFIKWHDDKCVHVASTYVGISPKFTVKNGHPKKKNI